MCCYELVIHACGCFEEFHSICKDYVASTHKQIDAAPCPNHRHLDPRTDIEIYGRNCERDHPMNSILNSYQFEQSDESIAYNEKLRKEKAKAEQAELEAMLKAMQEQFDSEPATKRHHTRAQTTRQTEAAGQRNSRDRAENEDHGMQDIDPVLGSEEETDKDIRIEDMNDSDNDQGGHAPEVETEDPDSD